MCWMWEKWDLSDTDKGKIVTAKFLARTISKAERLVGRPSQHWHLMTVVRRDKCHERFGRKASPMHKGEDGYPVRFKLTEGLECASVAENWNDSFARKAPQRIVYHIQLGVSLCSSKLLSGQSNCPPLKAPTMGTHACKLDLDQMEEGCLFRWVSLFILFFYIMHIS